MSDTECDPADGLRGKLPPRAEVDEMAKVLKALADPTRLQILGLIRTAPERAACVCDLTEPIGFSQPTISHHLKILADAGLLDREKRGAWAWYSIRESRVRECSNLIAGVVEPATA